MHADINKLSLMELSVWRIGKMQTEIGRRANRDRHDREIQIDRKTGKETCLWNDISRQKDREGKLYLYGLLRDGRTVK